MRILISIAALTLAACGHIVTLYPRGRVEQHAAFSVVTPDVTAADKHTLENLSNSIA